MPKIVSCGVNARCAYSLIWMIKNVAPNMIVTVRPRTAPCGRRPTIRFSAHQTVKLENTRIAVLTPVMSFGTVEVRVAHREQTVAATGRRFARAMKYAVKNDANSMISDPMKIDIPSAPMFMRDSPSRCAWRASSCAWVVISPVAPARAHRVDGRTAGTRRERGEIAPARVATRISSGR